MKKHLFLLKILMLSGAIIYTILLSSAGGSEKSSGPTTITFWTDQTQTERMSHIQLLMDTFEALNPDIQVELVTVDVNEFTQQMNTAASSNTLPNLIHTTTQYLLAYDEEGLIDTSATEQVLNTLDTSRFFEGSVNVSKSVSNSGHFMVPYHFMVQGIWYRKDWFAEAGLAPPNNKDALLKAAEYFHKPSENKYGLLVGTQAQQQYNEQIFMQLATAHNAYPFDKDGNLNVDSPEMLDVFNYYKELAKYTPPGPQTWRARDYYLQGKMAMFFYSSFIMDDLALQEVAANSLTAENFENLEGADFDKDLVTNTGFVSSFKWDEESSYAEINGLSILKTDNAAEKAATQKLIEYLFEKDTYISWVHMVPGGMFPVLKEVVASDEFFNDPKGVYVRYGKEKINDLVAGVNNPKSFIVRDGVVYPQAATTYSKAIIPDAIYKITQEGKDVKEVVAEAKKQMQEVISQ